MPSHSKLTNEQIEEILDSKMHPIDLAKKFNISRPHVYNIRRGMQAKEILSARELAKNPLFVFDKKESK